jgi:F-type H+-transporting ATPase subunit b
MLIDWFTVGAQVLNFLVLVWLLKRFLYKPILGAIETRENGIRKELADADAKRDQAKKDGEDFRSKNEVFDRERAGLLAKAADEAKAERQKLLDTARADADALASKRRDALKADSANLNVELGRTARKEVFSVARKALADLAFAGLEERMAAVFASRLRAMDDSAKDAFAGALKSASEPAVVRSAFELDEPGRDLVRKALNETFSADVPVRFETSPDLVAGVEISTSGQKMAWSISEYLEVLEKDVKDLLEAKTE